MSLEELYLAKLAELGAGEYNSAIEADNTLTKSQEGIAFMIQAMQAVLNETQPAATQPYVSRGNRGIRVRVRSSF